ncbi:thrombin inhibitor, putative [Ixodes scapularis]|uniref:Thrombin inhibitor, putative n=1 Tax=Ixodes scapularis TaxID=6945 RepID=B7PRI2_IXOSC|nr:thrombin inhibitor, putative [Ixodes scapularis]|eukprot:XP_002399745.1 thrombin inhibitor, putative [Ixodes scapularis]
MHQKGDFKMGHCSDLKVTALEIPYKGNKMSMIILLPEDVEGLSVLEEHLTAPKLSALLGGMYVTPDVNLRLPKFKLEQSIGLKDVLMAMGVKDFFTSLADLSGISAAGNLCASDVIHKAFVEVNEEGTEAAAATAIPMMLMCARFPQVVNFFVDHPFMFLIHSHDPDVVLFMGSIREL